MVEGIDLPFEGACGRIRNQCLLVDAVFLLIVHWMHHSSKSLFIINAVDLLNCHLLDLMFYLFQVYQSVFLFLFVLQLL